MLAVVYKHTHTHTHTNYSGCQKGTAILCLNICHLIIHSVEVSWYIGVFTRLSRWEPGFESHQRRGTFVLQQGNLSTLLLSTQVYKWRPGRRWQIIVYEFASAIIGCYTRQGMLPGEWKLCTVSAALKMYPMTGVIIRCKRFGPHGKSVYKN